VLKAYLGLDLHQLSDQVATRPEALDVKLSEWSAVASANPTSRHALLGLASVQRFKAEQTGRVSDRRAAARSYVRAAELGLEHGAVRHTREIAVLLSELGDRAELDRIFTAILVVASQLDGKYHYIALVDYADGLARLGDLRAAGPQFEQAITVNPVNNVEAVNKYAKHLLDRGDAATALAVLERLTRRQRLMWGLPAFLRKDALQRLGRDTRSADDEIQQIERRGEPMVGGVRTAAARASGVTIARPDFSHGTSNDDCRSATFNAQLWCSTVTTWCYWPYTVNLGEILYNEARGEAPGAQAAVAWTVRNRSKQGVDCDSYVGGINYHTCRNNLPCSFPPPYNSECSNARQYCCVEHGGTMSVGASHLQFNDGHVPFADIDTSSVVFLGFVMINGELPDPSAGFYVPPGVSNCIGTCDVIGCGTGVNFASPSPAGAMEYLGFAYTANPNTCKWPSGFVCANGGNNNFFWNRAEPIEGRIALQPER